MVVFDNKIKSENKKMKVFKTIIAILITMGLIFSQQAMTAEKKSGSTLIPPDNYIKTKNQAVNKAVKKKTVNAKPNKIIRPGPGLVGPDIEHDRNLNNDDINYSNNEYMSSLNPTPGYRVLISSGIPCNSAQ